MERVYSEHDLITRELEFIEWRNRSKGFLETVLHSVMNISKNNYEFCTHAPTYLVLRGEALCNFIVDEYDFPFSLRDLMWITYKDFLSFCYRNKDNHKIYELIRSRDLSDIEVHSFSDREETVDIITRDIGTKTRLYITLSKNEALAGEVILRDLNEAYEHNWQLEDVIRIMFIDFMKEYNRGNLPNAVNNIMDFYKKRMEK